MDRVLAEYQHRVRARLFNVADQYSLQKPPTQYTVPVTSQMIPAIPQQIPPKNTAIIVHPKSPGTKNVVAAAQSQAGWLSMVSIILIIAIVGVVVAILYFLFTMNTD